MNLVPTGIARAAPSAVLAAALVFCACASVGIARPSAAAAQDSRVDTAHQSSPETSDLVGDAHPAESTRGSGETRNSEIRQSYNQQTGVALLPGPDGRLVPVPADATLQEFLRWLKEREGRDFAVNWVSLEGSADDERATLEASVRLQLVRDDGWVRVPLYFNEAVLREPPEYQGDGQSVYAGYDRERGYQWWLKGAGRHELTLSLVSAVSREAPSRRLGLSLPPDSAGSRLRLEVPVPAAQLKVVPPKGVSLSTEGRGRTTTIELLGVGARLDLQWQSLPPARTVQTVLRSHTSIGVVPDEETTVLKARQTIEALEGSFSRVSVRLPEGFELLSVEGPQYRNHAVETGNRAVIELKETTTGPIDLQWTLVAKLSFRASGPDGRRLVLDGFEVDRARNQTGEVAVARPEGRRLAAANQDEDRDVDRIDVGRFRAVELLDGAAVAAAWRFYRQPFRLVRELREIEPHYTVEPTISLNVHPERVELDARFEFDAGRDRGGVREITVHWPGWRKRGWRIAAVQSPDAPGWFDEAPSVKLDDGDAIRLSTKQPQTGRFTLHLRAERSIAPANGPVAFNLPRVAAPDRRPTNLLLTSDDHLQCELVPSGETSIAPIAAGSAGGTDQAAGPESAKSAGAGFLESGSGLTEAETNRVDRFRIDSTSHAFAIKVTAHEREVQVTTQIEVEVEPGRSAQARHSRSQAPLGNEAGLLERAGDSLKVRQRIIYHVRYGRIDSAELRVPAELLGRVEFRAADGRLLTSRSQAELGNERGIPFSEGRHVFEFAEPRIGTVELICEFSVPVPGLPESDAAANVQLPLVNSADARFARCRVELARPEGLDVAVDGAVWKERSDDGETAVWETAETVGSVPLTLTASSVAFARKLLVRRSLLRAVIDEQGLTLMRCQYRLEGPVSMLEVSFPAGLTPETFWWGTRRIAASSSGEAGNGEQTYRLDVESSVPGGLPATADRQADVETHLLTIDCRVSDPQSLDWMHAHRLPAPVLAAEIWTEQTLWQVSLPDRRHLFTDPPHYSPGYHWRHRGVLWRRTPQERYSDLDAWIGADDGPPTPAELSESHAYVFGRLGPAVPLAFHSVTRSLAVLFGAGTALLLGLVLIKVPPLRNILTLLAAACGLAILALWYTAPIELLVQPAMLGVVLAIAAAAIDRFLRRERPGAVLTISTHSDFFASASGESAESAAPAPARAGSEDPTSVRAHSSRSQAELGNEPSLGNEPPSPTADERISSASSSGVSV